MPFTMRKPKKNILLTIIILIPFITILISWLLWHFEKGKELNVLILDKTVPLEKRNEHLSFNWILDYNKFVKNGKLYDSNTDYFGFFPLENKKYRINDLDSLSEKEITIISDTIEMAYYTDTYGIYYNEWYNDTLETEHSKKIYGGLSENDVFLLSKLKENNKLIISEFNLLASPTSAITRKKAEELLDIRWTGWTGRYFDNLDTVVNPEIPQWARRLYRNQYKKDWAFNKAGIILVHESSLIVVLEKNTHLIDEVQYIQTTDYGIKKFDLPEKMYYPYWFDITMCGTTNKLVSKYKIEVNNEGEKLLQQYGIPSTFPCVIESQNERFYYFAGDFADNPIPTYLSHFKGSTCASWFLYTSTKTSDRTKFFWKYYIPLVSNILDNYYHSFATNNKY